MILPCSAILAGCMLSGSWASNWKGKGRSKETPRILIPTSLRAKVKGAEVNASSRTMICPCSIIRFFIFKENGAILLIIFFTAFAIVGSFAAGFILIPIIGIKGSIIFAGAINILIGSMIIFKSEKNKIAGEKNE